MRSYGQYCSVARALDVVGDRWTLLVVRELLFQGACRFTDLRRGLPGIATNVLSQRLKEMEDNGLVRRERARPPVATDLYELTDRGRELTDVLEALGRWGVALMSAPREGDEFRSQWIAFAVEHYLVDARPTEPDAVIEVDVSDVPAHLVVSHGTVELRLEPPAQPDALIAGDPQLVMAVLTGHLELDAAQPAGVALSGDRRVLERVIPVTR